MGGGEGWGERVGYGEQTLRALEFMCITGGSRGGDGKTRALGEQPPTPTKTARVA